MRFDEFFFFVNELVRGTVNDGIEVNESTTDARVSQARDVFSHAYSEQTSHSTLFASVRCLYSVEQWDCRRRRREIR